MHSAPSAEGGFHEEGAETEWLSLFGYERKQNPGLDIQLAPCSSNLSLIHIFCVHSVREDGVGEKVWKMRDVKCK